MDERLKLIARLLGREDGRALLGFQYTGYNILACYNDSGQEGLADRWRLLVMGSSW